MFLPSHFVPISSNQPGYGARRRASAATDFPGRYRPAVALPPRTQVGLARIIKRELKKIYYRPS
jgi:hypothetical protein